MLFECFHNATLEASRTCDIHKLPIFGKWRKPTQDTHSQDLQDHCGACGEWSSECTCYNEEYR